MKRISLLSITMVIACATAAAQSTLNIGRLFDGSFRNNSHAVETLISGQSLRGYDLDKYRSLTITDDAAQSDVIEPLVRADARSAVDREVINRSGRLYYGFYRLKPVNGGVNRYILYLNQTVSGGHKIILLYLEGKADAAKVKKMLKQ